ncbi:MAG: hypothetical protein JNK16_00470 [Phycisphaerales bacterium]|nr:hypothetical protein [Phycisphaerales bacterium]
MAGRIIHDDTLVTLDFPGGTIASYAQAIRKAAEPDLVNLFVDSQAAGISVPPIRLTKASIFDSLSLVGRNGQEPDGRYLNLSVEVLESTAAGGSPVYKIRANFIDPPGNPNRPFDSSLEVISLNPIIGLPGSSRAGRPPLDVKTVLGAIEAAVAVSDASSSTPPVLKFHEASGLLFVKGTNAQRNVAIEVVRQLRSDIENERAAEQAATAGRDSKKMLMKRQPAEEVAEMVRKQLEGKCCVQLEVDGKYIIITGDKELVAEAAQRAYAIDGMPQRPASVPKSEAK